MNATCVAATGVGNESWREDGAVDDHGGFSPPEDEGERRCFLEEPGRVVDTVTFVPSGSTFVSDMAMDGKKRYTYA